MKKIDQYCKRNDARLLRGTQTRTTTHTHTHITHTCCTQHKQRTKETGASPIVFIVLLCAAAAVHLICVPPKDSNKDGEKHRIGTPFHLSNIKLCSTLFPAQKRKSLETLPPRQRPQDPPRHTPSKLKMDRAPLHRKRGHRCGVLLPPQPLLQSLPVYPPLQKRLVFRFISTTVFPQHQPPP